MYASTNNRKKPSGQKRSKEIESLREKLYTTQDALKVAEEAISHYERREKQNHHLLTSKALSDEEELLSDIMNHPVLQAKVKSLKHIHNQKVKSLMKSLDAAKKELSAAKGHDKEHRRSALIQSLRKQQRKDELVIDVLKSTLRDKVSDFQQSDTLVNEFIIKKTISGPKRFRPKTREELENDIKSMHEKLKTAMSKLQRKSVTPKESSINTANNNFSVDREEVPNEGGHAKENELLEEIDRLQVLLESRNVHISNQDTQLKEALDKCDLLQDMEAKYNRLGPKYKSQKITVQTLRDENLNLIQEKERMGELNSRFREEIEFMKKEDMESSEEIVKLEGIISELKNSENSNKELEMALKQVAILKEDLKTSEQDATESITVLKQDLLQAQEKLRNAETQAKHDSELLLKVQEELVSLKETKEPPVVVKSEVQHEPSSEENQLRLELATTKPLVEEKDREITKLMQEIENLKTQELATTKTLVEKDKEIIKLTQEIEELKNQGDSGKTNNDLAKELNEVEVELDDALLQLEIQEACHAQVRKYASTLRAAYEKSLKTSYPEHLPTEKEISKRIKAKIEEDFVLSESEEEEGDE